MDPDALSKAFVEHYYSTFDTNRAGLANLYQESSMLTFEGQRFKDLRTSSTSSPLSPSSSANTASPPSIASPPVPPVVCLFLLVVIFNLPVNSMLLSSVRFEMFHLMPTPQGSFYVFNDIFRLNYA
ncbi:putative nuclear transport factor 2, NTF2-like domain superfamily [Helianthus annuus]|nr:putative nuclear transport factor 2, NTF2-like domain superfamily [Helianthus annuus]